MRPRKGEQQQRQRRQLGWPVCKQRTIAADDQTVELVRGGGGAGQRIASSALILPELPRLFDLHFSPAPLTSRPIGPSTGQLEASPLAQLSAPWPRLVSSHWLFSGGGGASSRAKARLSSAEPAAEKPEMRRRERPAHTPIAHTSLSLASIPDSIHSLADAHSSERSLRFARRSDQIASHRITSSRRSRPSWPSFIRPPFEVDSTSRRSKEII